MRSSRSTQPPPAVRNLPVWVRRPPFHGLDLSISIIISRLLVYRFDNVTACTVHCVNSHWSVLTSAEVTGSHGGAEVKVSAVRAGRAWSGVGARRPSGLGVRHLKGCKDCPSATFEGFDPSLKSICKLSMGPLLRFISPSFTPQSLKHMTGIRQSADQKWGKYLHAVKIQDQKRTRVEILL